jgi:hypothetical protein
MSDDDNMFKYNMMEGMSQFSGIRGRAFWKEMFNLVRGKPIELLSFDDIKHRLRLREESYRGLQDVPLAQIAGSVGRYRDFTRDFLPKSQKSRDRWSRVYAVANSQTGLPPIELYKVGEVYFVRDGNHRVSVARHLGAKTIQAHVTELPTTVEVHAGMSEADLENAAAYAAFLEESTIAKVRPHHQSMTLSEHTRYSELLGHIYLHKSILEFMADRELTLEEAAIHWYDHVFRPAVTLIRKYNMMASVPDRTEGDLYLWIIDHLRELRDQFGEEAPRKISDALVDFLQERKMPVPDDLLKEKDESMILSRTQLTRAVEEIRDKHEKSSNGFQEPDTP